MSRFLLTLTCIFSLSFLLMSCFGSSNIDKLNGKWAADATESMKLSGQALDNELVKGMAEMLFGAIKMEIDAKAKKIAIGMGSDKMEGDFRVLSDSGKTVVLQSEGKFTFEFVNDDLVIMRDDKEPNKAVAFRRVKK